MNISKSKLKTFLKVLLFLIILSIISFLFSFYFYSQYLQGEKESVSFKYYYFDTDDGPLTIVDYDYVGHIGRTSWTVNISGKKYSGNEYLYRVRLVDKNRTLNKEYYCTVEINKSIPHFDPKPKLIYSSDRKILMTKLKSFIGSMIFRVIISLILFVSIGLILFTLKKLYLS